MHFYVGGQQVQCGARRKTAKLVLQTFMKILSEQISGLNEYEISGQTDLRAITVRMENAVKHIRNREETITGIPLKIKGIAGPNAANGSLTEQLIRDPIIELPAGM